MAFFSNFCILKHQKRERVQRAPFLYLSMCILLRFCHENWQVLTKFGFISIVQFYVQISVSADCVTYSWYKCLSIEEILYLFRYGGPLFRCKRVSNFSFQLILSFMHSHFFHLTYSVFLDSIYFFLSILFLSLFHKKFSWKM